MTLYFSWVFDVRYSFLLNIQVPTEIKDTDALEHEFEIDGWARWDMPSDDYYDMVS